MECDMLLSDAEYQKLRSTYLCWDMDTDSRYFTAFIVASRVVLYERKVYYTKNHKIKSVFLHAIRLYRSFEECEQALQGDLAYYIYSHPIIEGEIK